ncbi:unnamed protein product [Vitrella brassicaformis CCMP3155]|uniref:Uncharacterized protein n=1 Tax=Vitrella brassicaformis (strain CCMP3155) TaxID=1169540 RepID=A0A0G4F5M9_VITBC|nr:unnamed protein product [Vitrella brassicaformis CCMP3155]|eukprot:CEM07046.1 unnamed protein product [Vitrella brassicaformis CCMP3155]
MLRPLLCQLASSCRCLYVQQRSLFSLSPHVRFSSMPEFAKPPTRLDALLPVCLKADGNMTARLYPDWDARLGTPTIELALISAEPPELAPPSNTQSQAGGEQEGMQGSVATTCAFMRPAFKIRLDGPMVARLLAVDGWGVSKQTVKDKESELMYGVRQGCVYLKMKERKMGNPGWGGRGGGYGYRSGGGGGGGGDKEGESLATRLAPGEAVVLRRMLKFALPNMLGWTTENTKYQAGWKAAQTT